VLLRPLQAGALLLACLVLAAPPGAGASERCPGATATALSPRALEVSVTCLINARRADRGRRRLRQDQRLRRAAIRQSSAMVDQGFFAHTWPSGLTFMARIRASRFLRGARTWVVAENLAWGTGAWSTPESLVDAWMGSPSHRSNVLWPGFRRIGVGATAGTPHDAEDPLGVTLTTDFGVR
jgi:uncharacterized protein YkwD